MTARPAGVLVVGVGNPSRGDDALGPAFVERAGAALAAEVARGELELLTDFQLQVEHALDLQGRARVVFVDASVSAAAPFAYAAVAPAEGRMVTMLAPKCNTDGFDAFLRKVAEAFAGRRVVMFLDGAGWHKAKRLKIPETMRLEFLPPYTPECNPVEHLWDELREKHFANRLFQTLQDVEVRLQTGLDELDADPQRLKSIACFPWISGWLLYL